MAAFVSFCTKLLQYVIVDCRISGNAALSKDIHASVSAQMKKNFAKSRWKVSLLWLLIDFTFTRTHTYIVASVSRQGFDILLLKFLSSTNLHAQSPSVLH